MPSKFKKIAVIGGALVLLGGIALSVFASFYLNSSAFRDRLLATINAHIQGRIHFSGHHLSLISGRLVLSDLALAEPDEKPVVNVRHFSLTIFWPALAWHTVDIASLIIEQAEITLRQDSDNQLNILRIFEPAHPATTSPAKSPSRPWQVRVETFALHQAGIHYTWPAKDLAVTASQIDAAGDGNLMQRSGRLRLTAGSLAVKAKEIDEHLEHLAVTAAYDDQADLPIQLAVKALESSISLKGRIEDISPTLQLKAACDLDLALARLNPWLPQVKDLTGRLKGQATLQGVLDDPQVSLKLALTDGGIEGVLFQALNLDATLEQRKLMINDLRLLNAWSDLKLTGRLDLQPVFPQTLSKAEPGWDQIPYSMELQIGALKPDEIPRLSFPLQGTWQGRVHLAGTGFDPAQASTELDTALKIQGLKRASATQAAAGKLDLKARWRDQILTVEELHGVLGNTTLQARGHVDWRQRQATYEGAAASPDLAGLGLPFDISLPRGRIDLKFKAQGPWQQPTGHAGLKAEALAMAGWRFGNLDAAAQLDKNGNLNFTRLILDNSGGRLAGQGHLGLFDAKGRLQSDPALKAAFDISRLRLSDFSSQSPLNVELDGRLAMHGRLLHPGAALELDSGLVQWQTVACKTSGTARWDDGFLEVSKLLLSRGRSVAELKATADWRVAPSRNWSANPVVSVDFKADPLYLEDFLPDATGAITAQANLKGAVSSLAGTFAVSAKDLGTGNTSWAAADLQGHLGDNVIHLDRLALILAPGQEALGSGWYALDQRFQLALKGSDLALDRLAALQQQGKVGGRLDVDVRADGTVENPQMSVHLLIRSPSFKQRQFDDFGVDLQLQDGTLRAAADLNFKVSGHARLDSGDFDVAAEFDRSDLSSFLSLALKGQWAAHLSGRVQASGNWHHPADMRADADLSNATLDYEQVTLITLAQLSARLDHGRVSMPPTSFKLMQQGDLILSVDGDLQTDLVISAKGELPLAVLAPFTEAVENPRGEIHIDAHAQGPWHRLQWRADLTADNAGGVLTDLDQTLHGLNGKIQFSPDQVRIEHLTGMLDDGSFGLDGQVGLSDGRLGEGTIHLTARSLPLQWPDTMDMKVSANLTLKGDLQKAGLDGRIVILEGAYYKQLKYNLFSAITAPQRARPVAPIGAVRPWMRTIALNVTITSRYPFLVDNNVARLEIAPDLKLTGTVANPLLGGRAKVITDGVNAGEVFFRGKTFTVQQGVVDFINPYKIEPTLDIVAQTQIRDWMIKLEVSGPPDNLLIKLSSDPAESDSNILSLILLGRTNGEVSSQKDESRTNTGEMLASLMTSMWGEQIKKSTGVDILEVETSTGTEGGTAGTTQFTVGKQLTRRLTVKYALESGTEQMVQRAISEYRLLENILVSGYQDTAGSYGGELLLRIEFW